MINNSNKADKSNKTIILVNMSATWRKARTYKLVTYPLAFKVLGAIGSKGNHIIIDNLKYVFY